MNTNNNIIKEFNFENITLDNSRKKIKDDEFKIIQMSGYDILKTHQFKISQLKFMCEHYKLKKYGNKLQLLNRLYNYLKYSLYVIKIQKYFRGFLLRRFIFCGGIAYKNRKLCVNDTDFATLDSIEEIPYNQFFSFSEGNSIYGCDIKSFYGLLYNNKNKNKLENQIINPYTREKISNKSKTMFKLYLKYAKLNNILQIKEEVEDEISPQKKLELKIVELFQYINELGNYSDSSWFMNLPRHMIVIYIRELHDIWNYRAQLTPTIMREIVPPHGNPFMGLQLQQCHNEEQLRRSAIRIIEYMVKSSYTFGNRSLGAYYVLAALTIVSEDARNALPWLYESVNYINNNV